MLGTILYGPGDVRCEDVPEPSIVEPTDAIIRLSASCICGSDLWPFRGLNEITKRRCTWGTNTAASWSRSAAR